MYGVVSQDSVIILLYRAVETYRIYQRYNMLHSVVETCQNFCVIMVSRRPIGFINMKILTLFFGWGVTRMICPAEWLDTLLEGFDNSVLTNPMAFLVYLLIHEKWPIGIKRGDYMGYPLLIPIGHFSWISR